MSRRKEEIISCPHLDHLARPMDSKSFYCASKLNLPQLTMNCTEDGFRNSVCFDNQVSKESAQQKSLKHRHNCRIAQSETEVFRSSTKSVFKNRITNGRKTDFRQKISKKYKTMDRERAKAHLIVKKKANLPNIRMSCKAIAKQINTKKNINSGENKHIEKKGSSEEANLGMLVNQICQKYEFLNNKDKDKPLCGNEMEVDAFESQSSGENSDVCEFSNLDFETSESSVSCGNEMMDFHCQFSSSDSSENKELVISTQDDCDDCDDYDDCVDSSLCSFIDSSKVCSNQLNGTYDSAYEDSSSCEKTFEKNRFGKDSPLFESDSQCSVSDSIDFVKGMSSEGFQSRAESEQQDTASVKGPESPTLKLSSNKANLFGYFQRREKTNSIAESRSLKPQEKEKLTTSSKGKGKLTALKSKTILPTKQFHQKMSTTVKSKMLDMTIEEFASPERKVNVALNLNAGRSKRKSKNQSPRTESKKLEQLYIDVGQRDFGHTACETCGMVYTKTLEEDSLQHAKYHQKMMQRLKFKGWKTERILQEFHDGRIIQINPDDSSLHQRKVVQLREIVDGDLGFSYSKMHHQDQEKVFLFISNQRITGCAIAVPIKKAYRAMLTTNNSAINTTENQLTQTWCCSSDPVPAVCGISRIWVLKQARRKNIASRLVDAVRNYFIFGVVIAKTKLAFSDPTTDGRLFAQSYSGTQNILVFR